MKQIPQTIPLLAVCAIGLIACRANEPTPLAGQPVDRATPRATATLQLPSQPTEPSNKTGLTSYDDPTAPFTIQYPVGWKVREEPESISFQAQDQSAAVQVILYEYPEGAPKTATAKDVFDRFTQAFAQNTGLKASKPTTRSDGSVSADVEFQDPATRKPLQGFVRVLLAQNRRYHFIVLFAADQNQFARYKPIGATVIDSFRER